MTPSLKHPSMADGVVGRIIPFKAKGFNLYETAPAYLDSVELALRDGFFESKEVVKNVESPFCVVAQELQQLVKNECAVGKCAGSASVASVVRIYEGANKIGESINGAKFDYADITPEALSTFVGVKAYEHQLNSIAQHKSKLN